MTNPKTTQCGIFYQSKKLIEVETGYSRDTIDKLIDRFIAYGKVLYNNIFYEQCKKYGHPLESIFQGIEITELAKDNSLDVVGDTTVEELAVVDFEGVAAEDNNTNVTLEEVVEFFNNNIRLITPHESEKFIAWSEKIDYDVLLMAAEEAVDHNARNISYINGILCNWAALGLTTREKLLDYKQNSKFQREDSKKSQGKVVRSNAQAYEYVD